MAQTLIEAIRPNRLWVQLLAALGLGLLLGVASFVFSPLWILAGLLGTGLVYAMLRRPEIALLGILMATSSIIFESRLPILNIGIGSLHISDILLLSMLVLIAVRWLVEPDFKIARTPLDWPLLIFLGVAVLSTSIAVIQQSVELEEARRDLRRVAYFSTFFIVTNLIRNPKQLRLLLRGIFIIASIVALAMIAQFYLGSSAQFLPGYVGDLQVSGSAISGVARIVPPGTSLNLVAFVTLSAVLSIRKYKAKTLLGLLLWLLLGIALVLTFLRSHWLVVGGSLILLTYLNRDHIGRLVTLALIGLTILAMVLLLAIDSPETRALNLVSGAFRRLETLTSSDVLKESSLQWRLVESEYAIAQIKEHPILGLGLGTNYRPFDPRIDSPTRAWDARGFIHSGHLSVLVTMGVVGYVSLIVLSAKFLVRGFRNWRNISDIHLRGIVLGFTVTYLGLLFAAIVNGIFGSWAWTPIIGIMMGINEVAIRRSRMFG